MRERLKLKDRNAATPRTQSFRPRISSASPRFKSPRSGQLLTNTQIPACIWFLTKTKQKRGRGAAAFRDRTGEVLFIDARKLGYMVDRVLRAFTDEDTEEIVSTFHAWKRGPIITENVSAKALAAGSSAKGRASEVSEEVGYEDIPGFCRSATLDEIAEHGYVLTPGRYVGAEEVEDDGVPFAEKMEGLTRELATQFHESEKLQSAIRDNIQKLFVRIEEVGNQLAA